MLSEATLYELLGYLTNPSTRRVLPSKFALRRTAHSYSKHEYLCLALPCSPFIMNLTVHCDVSNNPRPILGSRQNYNSLRCGSSKNNYLARPEEDKVIKYSRSQLYSIRKQSLSQNPHIALDLKTSGLFHSRGVRAGLKVRQRTMREQLIPSIKTSSSKSRTPSLIKLRDTRDKKSLRKIPYAKIYDLPVVLSTNLRALRNKTDELQLVASLKKADVLCVTES